jgi:hypothetical protein
MRMAHFCEQVRSMLVAIIILKTYSSYSNSCHGYIKHSSAQNINMKTSIVSIADGGISKRKTEADRGGTCKAAIIR